jgi:endonuclease/exonuclease/phosphatase family metal-dependent hydrolase
MVLHNEGRHDFINWISELDSSNMKLWMILGDFNQIRAPEDRNRPKGDINNMMSFNIVIQAHDLEEIPLEGRSFTWSNMQDAPLIEKRDWIFTSAEWTVEFPNTMSFPLARLGSDHTPIHV